MISPKIYWGRVAAGGIAAEFLVLALVLPVRAAFYVVLFTITSPGRSQPVLYQAAHVLTLLGGFRAVFDST